MSKLTRKESMAIATIHDALRELRNKGRLAKVEMHTSEINIIEYADDYKQALKLKKLLCFFKDEDDKIEVRRIPSSYNMPDFYVVELKKMML